MFDPIIRCAHRRRITVEPKGTGVVLKVWFRDPPHGKNTDVLEMDQKEFERFLLLLTGARADA